MTDSEANRSRPVAWILVGDKAGDAAQMRILAEIADVAAVAKNLQFNKRYRLPNIVLGATLRSVEETSRALLAPPWPDLVLSSGKRSAPVARWIKRQSGGRTRLVHIGRPWGRLAWFDLVLAMPQYALPDRANVFQARMPFNRADPQALARAADQWRQRLSHLPRPWIGLLAGGSSKPMVLDAATARSIARATSQKARNAHGSVLAVTSRRTGEAVTQALFEALDAPALRHAWRPGDRDNPYLAILALADELVVTGDSASMLAEAIRTGKPVSIAALPQRLDGRRRRLALMKRVLPQALFAFLVDLGLLTATRDLTLLHDTLVGQRLAALLPASPPPRVRFDDDLEVAAVLVRTLASRSREKTPSIVERRAPE